jgi:predicted metal-dependent enzyme (double-stranded beta helix superfamily)
MAIATYTLEQFVRDLRRITTETPDPREVISRVRPLARDLALAREGWLTPKHYGTDAAQGFGAHLLHEEADHTLAVMAVSWVPGRGAPPHNHGTWAVVAGSTDRRRTPSGSASTTDRGPATPRSRRRARRCSTPARW